MSWDVGISYTTDIHHVMGCRDKLHHRHPSCHEDKLHHWQMHHWHPSCHYWQWGKAMSHSTHHQCHWISFSITEQYNCMFCWNYCYIASARYGVTFSQLTFVQQAGRTLLQLQASFFRCVGTLILYTLMSIHCDTVHTHQSVVHVIHFPNWTVFIFKDHSGKLSPF